LESPPKGRLQGADVTATSQPVRAYRAKDSIEAHALAAYLEAAGIEAHVLGEYLQGAYAGLHVGGMDAPEIWVLSEDLPRAESAISDWRGSLDSHDEVHQSALSAFENQKPYKFQFSTAAMLWLMTCVAIFAAGVALKLVTYENWPTWIFALFVYSLVLLVAWKSIRGVRRPKQNIEDLADSE
jgi:hypothetical protein